MFRTRCMTYLSQLEAADGFVSNGVGVRIHLCFLLTVQCLNASSSQPAPQNVQSIPSTPGQLPQPMADPTPSSRAQTISFIFTSSRQRTNLRDQNVIGVVAAGGRASTNNVFPNTLPSPSSSTSKTAHSPAVLTPEQTRVHALGAKHAIPAHSPFVQLARNRSVSTVVGLPLQSPFSLPEEDILDRNRKGIDFYMDAARLAKIRPSKEPLSEPVTLISHLPSPSSSPLSLNDPVSSNTLTMFPKGAPNTHREPLEVLPTVVEPSASLTRSASPEISNASSKKKRSSRSRTRKEPARQEGKPERPSFLNVRYTKYLVCHRKRSHLTLIMVLQENDPDRPSFISCLSTKRDTSTSSHDSLSSGKSIASLDESIMGTSGFGVLGSGNAESVFGSAVVKQLPKRLGSDAQRTPSSTALDR